MAPRQQHQQQHARLAPLLVALLLQLLLLSPGGASAQSLVLNPVSGLGASLTPPSLVGIYDNLLTTTEFDNVLANDRSGFLRQWDFTYANSVTSATGFPPGTTFTIESKGRTTISVPGASPPLPVGTNILYVCNSAVRGQAAVVSAFTDASLSPPALVYRQSVAQVLRTNDATYLAMQYFDPDGNPSAPVAGSPDKIFAKWDASASAGSDLTSRTGAAGTTRCGFGNAR